MSIEDSRILANELENENLAADMLDAVSQLHSEDAPVELAQLGELPKTDRFAQPDDGEGAGDNRYRVENGIVQLPASTSLDDMRVEGNDLVLVQSDGTEIIIIDGALKIPTLLLGDVELSQQVLLAALEESGINVAAGPDGSYSATGTPPSSGADFETIEERQAEAIALAELLGDTSFGDGDGLEDNGVDDGEPTILSPLTQAFVLDEAVLVDNDQNNQTISGRLPFEQGPDFGTITRVEFSGAGNVDEEGSGAAQALAGITSGGSPITVSSFAAPTDGSILNFVALEGRDANGALVFQLTINNRVNGDFTFELVGKLDHPDAGSGGTQADLADLLRLGFTYTVTDLDGDFVTGSFNIDVMDDAPVRGEEVRGTAEDEAVNGGNNEADGLSAVATGALNIRWGADDADTVADLGGLGDRSIAFTNATVSVANAYNGASLTSLGLPVSTAVLANGTLVGYTGSTVPTSSAAANVVFHATLSDNGSGSYTFTLVKPLDHAAGDGANGENDLSLSFGYTATDSDGDTVTGRFTVDVRDDVATIGAPFAGGIVEEEQKQVAGDGNEGTEGEGDADSFGGFLGLQFRDRTTHETGGSLSISWGSDDANDGNGQPGDRSVQFGPDAVANLTALNLTSDGDAIKYTTVTVSGQQVLLAYTGNVIPTTVPTTTNAALAGNIVFSVALSDTGAGSYAFKLYDTLDHQGSVQGEDSQILNFQFTATDSDGDVTAPATFSVKVIDDQPIALGTILDRVVEEEELSNGNEDRVSGSGDLDADTSIFGLPLNLATDKADGSLNIAWGGDDGNKNVNGGFTGTQVAGDRSVVFSTGTGAAKILTANEVSQFLTVSGGNGSVAIGALTSEGKPLVFTLSANGSILTASADGKTVFTVKLSDQGNGSFDFDLDGVLDHPVKASGAANEDVLSFKFTFTARDGDGDIARNDFTVKVIDDAPVRGEEVRGTAEDEAVNGGNNEADGLSAVATGALNIRWGADDADTVADLGGLGDRSIAFTNATVSVANAYNGASLTSLGLPVSTAVLANGTLVGYTGSTVPTSSAAANVVFHATLSDNGSGSYTFTLVKPLDHAAGDGANGENDLSLSFGYTATDSDGDTVTGRFTVDVRDDVATIGAPFAGGIVEEEQKQVAGDGNEGTEGEGDADSFGGFLGLQFRDRTTHETGGSLSISWGSDDANDGNGQPGDRSVQFGPDAVANLTALNLTSDGDAIKYTTVTVSGQQVLLAYTGNVIPTTVPTTTNAALAGNIVFSVALSDTGAGSYAFKLYDTLDHQGSVQGEDSQILNFQFTATDSDGDVTAPATFSVKVIDDQPIALGTILDRVVEEEELSNGNEDRVSGSGDLDADTSIFGLPLNLATDKADGSLNIAWGGDDGNKNVNGGFTGTQVAGDRSVVFSTGTGAAKILTANEVSQFLTVSGGNGPVAIGALTSEGKPLVFTLSANGSILTASADGKTVFTVKLSDQGNGSFDFDLDGVLDHPVKASGAANEDVLSFKFTFTARDGDGDIARNDFTVKVIDDAPTVEDNAVVQLDDDSLVVGATPIVATGVLENELGADGGKVSWLSNGMTLGNNGLWYQYVSPTELIITQNQNGQTVQVVKMTITNQATGAYSIEQLAPVRHPVGGVEDNIEFTVSYEARDGDNDTAAGTITVKINDDMPTVEANAVVQLDDDSLVVGATPIVATGVLENELGADGGKVSWLSNGMTLGNNDLWYQYVSPTELIITQNQNGQTVQVVKMTITNQVTGAYSIEQLAPVRHPLGGVEDNIEFTVSYEARDGDNDTATGTITVNINDDTPTGGAGTTAWLNDDILSSGNPGGNGDHGLANTSNVLKHSFGADGPGGIAWSGITVTNGGSQADFTSSVSTDGKTLQVFQSGTLVITAVLNPLTGQYTLTQNAPIDHVTGGNENEIQFKFNYDVTDGDGDVAPGYIWVNVDDDTPTGGAGTTAWLNDDTLSSGNPGGNGDHGLANTSNVLKHSFGADGPGGIAWSGITVTNGGNQADFASSVSTDGKTLQVFQSGTLVITAVLNPLTGQYTLTQNAPIDHVTGGNENEIQFKFNYNVTDGDGDVAPGYIWVNVDDDTPTGGAGTTAWLNDDILSSGNPGGNGDHGLANTSNVLKHSFGADGPGGIAWSGITVTNGGSQADFTSSVSTDGKTLQVFQSGTLVITAVLNPLTGQYTLTQNAPIDHVTGGNENEIQFKFNYDVTDGDGDVAPGYIWVNVDDDTPTGGAGTTAWLNDDTLSSGNPGGNGDHGLANTSNVLKHSFGADGPGGIAWSGITVTNGGNQADFASSVSTDGKTLQVFQSGTLVITAVLNPLTGQYTLTQNAPIDHVTGGNENEIQFKFNYDVTDGDGDVAPGYIWVNVDDDTPAISAPAEAVSVTETGLPAVAVNFGSLNVNVGADKVGAHVEIGTAGGQPIINSNLTSDGVPLLYAVRTANGVDQELVAYKQGSSVDDPVFVVTVLRPGSFVTTLFQNLDHLGDNEEKLTLNLVARVYDGDGDYVDQPFSIDILDSIPTANNVAVPTGVTENQSWQVTLVEGTDFKFGADNTGTSLTIGTPTYTGIPTGVTLGNPTVQLGPDGRTITVDPGTAFDGLADGETVTMQIPYTVTDGDNDSVTKNVTVTIIGTNDAPTLAAMSEATYMDTAAADTFSATTGTLAGGDVDVSNTLTYGISGGTNSGMSGYDIEKAGTYGILYINSQSGAYLFQPNETSIEARKTDATESFTLTVSDGVASATKTLEVKIDGANDTAEIGGTATGAVTEDGTQSASGALSVSDRDTGDTGFQMPTSLAGVYGDFTFNASNGQWTYALRNSDANVQALSSGDVRQDTLTVYSADGSASQDIVVTITGADEVSAAPTVNENTSAAGRYAFSYDWGFYGPKMVDFATASLFSGAVGPMQYSFQQLTNNWDGWLTLGSSVTGNPSIFDDGLYIYRVTVTNSDGAADSTYVAFSALEASSWDIVVTTNSQADEGDYGDGNVHRLEATSGYITDTVITAGGDDVVIGDAGSNEVDAGSGDDAVYGMGGDDNLRGGSGTDFIDGGDGNDTIDGDNDNDVLLGGSGNDTIDGGNGNDILVGGSGADRLSGENGNDLLIGDQSDLLLDGGTGYDTLELSANFTSTDNNQIRGVERVVLTHSASLDLSNQSEGFKIEGSSGADIIVGGSGNDTINGGAGADRLTGGAGDDEFRLGRTSGTDTITDFIVNRDTLSFHGASTKEDHTSFASIRNSDDNRIILLSADNLTDRAIADGDAGDDATNSYVLLWNSEHSRAEVWFDTNWNDAGSRTLVAILSNINTRAKFEAIDLDDLKGHSDPTDPIILDLDKNGFAFSSLDQGVQFDINADGRADRIAWTSQDAILALDLDGNGLIDNGSEIFTPNFNGGAFESGLAALASLDSNGDGKIDAGDEAFSKLSVWVDANNNGVSDEGELSSLSDNKVASISLTTNQAGGSEDGQTIFAEGEFTFADGSTGNFVEVGFDTIFGSDLSDGLTVIGTDGDDILHGGMGQVVMAGGAGADTFVFDGTALDDLDVADIIADFSSSEGDVLDVTALLDTLLGEEASTEAAVSSIRATVDGSDTTVSVQVSDDSWKDVAVLQNHVEAVKILFKDEHHDVHAS